MATPKPTFHIRSISLPSRPTALDVSIDDHLCRLKASQAMISSSSSICLNLCSIKDLYEQLNSLVHLPYNQQVLSHDILRGEVEEVLDGSLAMLDISSSALDALSEMKQSILDLASALRRRSSSEGIDAFVMSRKKVCKTLSNCLVYLKKAEKCCGMAGLENNTLRILKEAESISLSALRSMLFYLMGRKYTPISQAHGWSLVAKLVKSKHVFDMEIENASEVEDLDRVLRALWNKSYSSDTNVLLKQLETLEMAIGEIQDGMDSVSRCFVKTRVSLLNVLN